MAVESANLLGMLSLNREMERPDAEAAPEVGPAPPDADDDQPGALDRMAGAEQALPSLKATMEEITTQTQDVGRIIEAATADSQKADQFAQKLLVLRRISVQLKSPTEEIWRSANKFVSELHEIDYGFRTLIERAPAEIEQDPSSLETWCEFFATVREFSDRSHQAFQSTQGLAEAIEPLEGLSRELRPVLRKLRHGLTIMVEAGEVTDGWGKLIDSSGVDCG